MNKVIMIIVALSGIFACSSVKAQSFTQPSDGYDVFKPIAKYIASGDAEKLSAWFADNLEISVFSTTSDSSKNQAKQIVKSFFDSYTPRTFSVNHTAGRSSMKYAIGTLNAGGETFDVTIFVSLKDDSYQIQQLKIEKTE